MAKKIMTVVLSATLMAALAGCDGSVSFQGLANALERTSGRDLVRGLAGRAEIINEEEEKSERRRDLIEVVGRDRGLNMKDDLGEILKSNKLYHDVVFDSPSWNLPGLRAYPVLVKFNIDGGYRAQINFLVEEKTMFWFMHLRRLPILESAVIKHGDDVLPLSDVNLFELMLDGDKQALKERSDKSWGAMQAAAAAAKRNRCEQQVASQGADFEVDPSSSDTEKEATVAKFQDQQNAAVKECLAN